MKINKCSYSRRANSGNACKIVRPNSFSTACCEIHFSSRRNIHLSDAVDQDERVEGFERVLGRQNQDISAQIIRWIYSGITFSLSHPMRGNRLKAETHSGLRGVTFLPLCLCLLGSYTYS